jgi:hypothetical protein
MRDPRSWCFKRQASREGRCEAPSWPVFCEELSGQASSREVAQLGSVPVPEWSREDLSLMSGNPWAQKIQARSADDTPVSLEGGKGTKVGMGDGQLFVQRRSPPARVVSIAGPNRTLTEQVWTGPFVSRRRTEDCSSCYRMCMNNGTNPGLGDYHPSPPPPPPPPRTRAAALERERGRGPY